MESNMSVMRTVLRILGQFAIFFLGGAPGAPKEEPEVNGKKNGNGSNAIDSEV